MNKRFALRRQVQWRSEAGVEVLPPVSCVMSEFTSRHWDSVSRSVLKGNRFESEAFLSLLNLDTAHMLNDENKAVSVDGRDEEGPGQGGVGPCGGGGLGLGLPGGGAPAPAHSHWDSCPAQKVQALSPCLSARPPRFRPLVSGH